MPKCLRQLTLWSLVSLISGSTTLLAADDSLPKVPEGFVVERAAGPPLVEHPMMAGFDDRGRLYVADSAGLNLNAEDLLKQLPNSVRRLEDTDGDGVFDKSTVFADKMTLPSGALWYRGAVYVASPPSIWKLQDTNDDGVADVREELVDKFGFIGNAADVHGCFLSPTGRIVWCDGRHGHEFRDEQGNITSKGKAARIFSCRLDGSELEAFCGGGMDNPVEVDFWPEGEMLGTVNILLNEPRADCLMHWLEGGAYPRHDQGDAVAEFQRTGDLLPPTTQFGHVAVSGTTRYRSAVFGDEYRDNIFTAIFNQNRIARSIVERSGSTFQTREENFLQSSSRDFHPTDVLEDADGSLLVIDTGGWFRIGCPQSEIAKPDIRGAIYRVRRADGNAPQDPRGLAIDWNVKQPAKLTKYLDDARPTVQEKAIDVLAQAEETAVEPLGELLNSPQTDTSLEARRNAVWALSRMTNKPAQTVLQKAIADPDASVRLAAVNAIGVNRDAAAVPVLLPLLAADTPPIRREAATALGRILQSGRPNVEPDVRHEAIEKLLSALTVAPVDRQLEHAILFAVIRIDNRADTLPLLVHSSPIVRRGALIALDQMHHGDLNRESVMPLLDTDDPDLLRSALEVIAKHDGWIGETIAVLGTWLSDPALSDNQLSTLRGVLVAQAGDPIVQNLVASKLSAADVVDKNKLLLWEVVERSTVEPFPLPWQGALSQSLRGENADIQLQAMAIIAARQLDQFDAALESIASKNDSTPAQRIAALRATAPRKTSLDSNEFRLLTSRLDFEVPALERLGAARVLAEVPLDDRQLQSLTEQLASVSPLEFPVLLRAFSKRPSAEVGLSLVKTLQKSAHAKSLGDEELSELLKDYPAEVQQAAAGLLAELRGNDSQQRTQLESLAALLADGDVTRGREVFYSRKAACASCHTVSGQGGKVGPDLTQIGSIRSGRDLLEAVAFPSASFARGYRPYVVATTTGQVHAGVISREMPDAIFLRTAELAEIRIPRNAIEELRESETSIMPKGLDTILSQQELRDLFAYLQARTQQVTTSK